MTPSPVPNGTNLVFAGKAYLAEGGPCSVVLHHSTLMDAIKHTRCRVKRQCVLKPLTEMMNNRPHPASC